MDLDPDRSSETRDNSLFSESHFKKEMQTKAKHNSNFWVWADKKLN